MAVVDKAVAGGGEAQEREPEPEPEPAAEASTFAELGICRELVEACDAMGWKQPTKIQAGAIPHALQGRDVIGLGQTGSGKTGAFALPIIQALLEHRQPFFACVMSPTRELAIQIAEQFEALGSAIGLVCSVLVGGVDRMQQVLSIAKRPHIVVGTPGRLLDHLKDTKGFSLTKVKYLVLDEADKLLNLEFKESLDDILKEIPKERRTYLFSATMTKKVSKLQRACLRNPVKVEVSSKYSTVDTLKQEWYFVPADYKDCYLVHVLNELQGSMIMIFVRTCESTRLLALTLRNLGFKALSISGQMSQDKRLGALNKFKAKDFNILICTDVASRGLDIQGVDVVMNYDIPMNSKDYVHRVGRTARAGQSGYAVSFVNQYEAALLPCSPPLVRVFSFFGGEISRGGTMLVYQDKLSGDELLSDSFPYRELENGVLWEVDGHWVVQGAVDVDIGANPSAEGGGEDEGVDDQAVKVVDIVDTFRLQEQPAFDKKQFIAYIKRYIKNLTAKLEGEELDAFKKNVESATKYLLSKLKDLQFFVGESMHDDGSVVFAYYKEGAADPTFLYFAHGLKEVKC